MGIDPASCTLLVVAGVIVSLAVLKTSPDLFLLGGLVLLMVLGVFPETSVALSGFANEGLLTVAVLFVVAEGMKQTGGLGVLGRSLLGQPGSLPMMQARLLLPVSLASAFLNTPRWWPWRCRWSATGPASTRWRSPDCCCP